MATIHTLCTCAKLKTYFTQFPSLNFLRGGHREGINEDNVSRHLIITQFFKTMLNQGDSPVLRRIRIFVQNNNCSDFLFPYRVRECGHCTIRDIRMVNEYVLDFCCSNIFSTTSNNILFTLNKKNSIFIILSDYIACMKPVIRPRLCRCRSVLIIFSKKP